MPKPQTTIELEKALPTVTESPYFRKKESKVKLGIEKIRKQLFSVNSTEKDDQEKLFDAEKLFANALRLNRTRNMAPQCTTHDSVPETSGTNRR